LGAIPTFSFVSEEKKLSSLTKVKEFPLLEHLFYLSLIKGELLEMIVLNLAQMQDKAIDLLNNYDGGDFTYKFTEKKGIKLFFEVTGDADDAAVKAKALIKAEPWGAVLFFNAAKA